MRPNDFEGEIEEEDAMCVGANFDCRYLCLCAVCMRGAKVQIYESKGARLPTEAKWKQVRYRK